MLQLCTSQDNNATPYVFRATGIAVYSLEEAMYHVFHYWRESLEDLQSGQIGTWVAELGLPDIAQNLIDPNEKQPSALLIEFLQSINYFSTDDINSIKTSLHAWEQRQEWERLKERADGFVARGEPAMAIPLYSRALKLEVNPAQELQRNIEPAAKKRTNACDFLTTSGNY